MSDQRIISEIISSGEENSEYSYDNIIKEDCDVYYFDENGNDA